MADFRLKIKQSKKFFIYCDRFHKMFEGTLRSVSIIIHLVYSLCFNITIKWLIIMGPIN